MLYKKEVDSRSKSKSADELSIELRELIIVYWKNFYHAWKLQKRAYDKGVKPWNYTLGNKIWLNNKYIKTKHNRKLEIKFFGLFWVFYPIGKQTYKLEFLRK